MLNKLASFFLFKGDNKERNTLHLEMLKQTMYFLSASGFAWGMFVVYKHESYSLWNFTFTNEFAIFAASIFYNTLWAVVFTYCIRLLEMFPNMTPLDEKHAQPTAKDEMVFREITEKVKQYERQLAQCELQEKITLTQAHIKELKFLSDDFSNKAQTQVLNSILKKKIIKLEKQVQTQRFK